MSARSCLRLFAWAAESDDVIVSHDPVGSSAIMRDISRSPVGQYVAWEYLSKNWDTQYVDLVVSN